jgi:hypothetical protein
MKKIRKKFKVIKTNLKINIDSFNIGYINIKLAVLKATMNQNKNVLPQKRVGGGGNKTLKEEDNPTRTNC